MITEGLIRKAYCILREKNQDIPDEVLDFILKASIEKHKQLRVERLKDGALEMIQMLTYLVSEDLLAPKAPRGSVLNIIERLSRDSL